MRLLPAMPIQRKLTLIIMLTSTVALLLSSAGFVSYELGTFRDEVLRERTALAEMLATSVTPALLRGDATAAEEVLAALQAEPRLVAACIYGKDKQPFAVYQRNDLKKLGWQPPTPRDYGDSFEGDYFTIYWPVMHRSGRLGTVYLKSDCFEMRERLFRYVGIVGVLLIVSWLAAYVLSDLLQRFVSVPVQKLVQGARAVIDREDYSVRVPKTSSDELGVLVDSFNQMLGQIQKRDEALRRSEERFRSLIENSSDLIAILDQSGCIKYASPSLERALGSRPGELIGEDLLELVHPEDISWVRRYLTQLQERVSGIIPATYRFPNRTGTWMTLEVIGKNLLDDPTVNGIVINARDITERKRAEQQLKTYAGQLERSNQNLQDFAYVASHDLQEPLRKIQAFGDRLRSKCADSIGEVGRDYLTRMQDAAARMQTLITDLLAFSRITTKALPFTPVDLDKVLGEVVSDLEVRIEQTKGRVEAGRLATIEADALQMRQLFQNLIGNALKFHKADQPPTIRIHAQLQNGSAPPRLRIAVTDNGIGFDQKYADRIFVIFQRLHGRGQYEGTGVGLAICKKIVERHGGSIEASSAPDEGTTFTITLPLRQQNGDDPE